MRSGRWAEWAAASFLLLGGLARCAGSAEPDGENHACFRALDCADGLVCVEGRCTADLAPIVPEGAGQGAPAGAMAGAAGGSAVPAGAGGGSSLPEAAEQ
jgi:hypothetical protein